MKTDDHNSSHHKNKESGSKINASHVSFGLNVTVGMILFMGGGYCLDKKIGEGSVWTLVGIFLGFIYCIYEAWKIVREIDKDKK